MSLGILNNISSLTAENYLNITTAVSAFSRRLMVLCRRSPPS